MKIFISGVSGYLGSKLAHLLSKDHEVIGLIRSTSSRKRISELNIELITIDHKNELQNAFRDFKPDAIIHTAALYGRNGESIEQLVEANISFPIRLLELAIKHQVKYFINTGSSLPDDVSVYAMTKNAFVNLSSITPDKGIQFVNLSVEHFYGPDDDESKFCAKVINACCNDNSLDLTEGCQERDFIYIDDLLAAFEVVISKINHLPNAVNVSVGSGLAVPIREFVELVAKISNSKSELRYGSVPTRSNEVMYSCADTSLLISLGWQCKYSLKDGLAVCIKHKKVL